jgi:hypothetical protein
MTTTAKQIDRFGNVSYTVTVNGVLVGQIVKASKGYHAENLTGSYRPVSSVKAGAELLAGWVR